jgi:hypothetical protein
VPVTANIYERVMKLTTPNGSATAFTLEIDGRQYLITAKHAVPEADPVAMRLELRAEVWECELTRLPGVTGDADIAVFALEQPMTPTLPTVPTLDGVMFSQDVYFLGYPYGLAMQMAPGVDTYAFVKKAILSASNHTAEGGHVLYLDGFNNPGFSGGPMVFYHQQTNEPHIGAVVSGYRIDPQQVVLGDEQELELFVRANSGIVITYSIQHALDAIAAQ